MNIWLITVGEPLPVDDNNPRLYRAGIISNMLASMGHNVIWWNSDFDHIKKKNRYGKDLIIKIKDNYSIHLLHSIGYKRNISLSRIFNHLAIARKFYKKAVDTEKPDIILCSYPTIELSYYAVLIGEKYSIPVVVDVRDLWPDIFYDALPSVLRNIGKTILYPFIFMARQIFSRSTAIYALTDQFLDWSLKYGRRDKKQNDHVFPMGYSEKIPDQEKISAGEKFWDSLNIFDKKEGQFIICFFGTLGQQFDLDTVIEGAKELFQTNPEIIFVICGDGEKKNYYKQKAGFRSNVIFPGWIGSSEIWTLMRRSSLGLTPYINIDNFKMNLPNKPIEYLSAGLPLLNCTEGVLSELISENNCGISYLNSDVSDFIYKIKDINNNKEKLLTMSANAKNLFKEKFVSEKVYGDMIAHLEFISNEYKAEKNTK